MRLAWLGKPRRRDFSKYGKVAERESLYARND